MYFNHLHLSKKQITAVLVFLFSIFGIQSSYADYYPSGPTRNVSEQTLIDNGWVKTYEQTYQTQILSGAKVGDRIFVKLPETKTKP